MQRRQPDLGAIAEQQEDEGDVEQGRVEVLRVLDQDRPDHGVLAFADDRTRRHVDQDGAEQRERNADAAEDEIFPRRFQRGVGAVDPDHQHRGQGRDFHRHPHQADVVRHECEVHAEHHGLVHGVVEAQIDRRQPAGVELMRDIARAEDAGGEADEGVEHDEDDVEIVDQHVGPGSGRDHEQRQRRQECREARHDVQPRRHPVARQHGQQRRRDDRDQQDCRHRIEGRSAHRCSPRKSSSAETSTESKRSRIRNRKMPMTMKAIRIEKATLISTTSGMPLAPVAASTSPFSSDMNPTTWLTALRRVTMTRRPSSTTDSAKARSSRASGSASAVTRSISTIRERDQRHPGQHGRADADRRFDVAMNAELLDDAMQRHRNDDRLEYQGDGRGDVEVRGVLDKGLPCDGQRQHQGMKGKHVEQRIEPVLIQHHQADQHQPAGQRMRDVEGEAVHLHQKLLDTNRSRVPSRPSISAAPRNCGTRKTRIFAVAVSNSARKKPATASLKT